MRGGNATDVSKADIMIVHPCTRLNGEMTLQGSKNSVLPIMAASVAYGGVTVLENCPEIDDVYTMAALLKKCGCSVKFVNNIMTIDASNADCGCLDSDCASKMRASILLMGSCLGRFGEFSMPKPGGCAIGSRPIDFHLEAMKRMGASIDETDDRVTGTVRGSMSGSAIRLPFPSVGATQNIIIAASLAEGATDIYNASREPEIWDLCDYLTSCGCTIRGAATGHITVCPSDIKKRTGEVRYSVPADRIAAGTILAAAACTTGNVCLNNVDAKRLTAVMRLLGAKSMGERGIVINTDKRPVFDRVVSTGPFPEFPTDLQSVFLVLMAVSGNYAIMEETVFDTRFMTAHELNKLGADIRTEGNCAYVYGMRGLHGGTVTAPDLRGGAALVVAGLAASEPVTVTSCRHIRRGYEDLAGDLNSLGAVILEE